MALHQLKNLMAALEGITNLDTTSGVEDSEKVDMQVNLLSKIVLEADRLSEHLREEQAWRDYYAR